jgi:2-methylisocitrate lyase-like PEP mutase family enzyme
MPNPDPLATDQIAKARAFRALHERPQPFLIPNPWDEGSAKILESLGFEALATTSSGLANMLGKAGVTRDEVLENCRRICAATRLPVNADLEDCFAAEPRAAAETIRLACEAGAVGGSIEDWTRDAAAPIYPFSQAVERVQAAVEAARALPVPFLLTARAENFLHSRPDLDDTLRRLQAFEQAGADVLYAPGRFGLEEIRTICASVSKPVNLVMGFCDPSLTLEQLGAAGVRRVSIGGGLSRVALQGFFDAAREMRAGRFGLVARMAKVDELRAAFRG